MLLLNHDHADLSSQGTEVDHQIEVHVDSRDGESGIDDDGFSVALDSEMHRMIELFCDERRNVGFECTRSESHDDDSDDEDTGKQRKRVSEDA